MTVVDLHEVSLRRGDTTILDQVSWTVNAGERWAILGRNGAGKTSLLQIAAARLHPTSGVAHILGQQLGKIEVSELRTRIGLASTALADRISPSELVRDVVLTAAYGMTGRWREQYDDVDQNRAADLLTAFGVDSLAQRSFGTLSEGERKRVQIARSLMADPELLLLDEPGAGLDLGGREELVGALSELARDRRSPVMIVVTHHVEEIPPNFTHVLLLRRGQVFAAGPAAETLTVENVSGAFDLDLQVDRHDGRWSARALPRQSRGAHGPGR